MRLREFLKNNFAPKEVEEQLIVLLTKNLRKKERKQIEELIKNKLLTLITNPSLDWSRFHWDGSALAYDAKYTSSFNAELKAFREEILKVAGVL